METYEDRSKDTSDFSDLDEKRPIDDELVERLIASISVDENFRSSFISWLKRWKTASGEEGNSINNSTEDSVLPEEKIRSLSARYKGVFQDLLKYFTLWESPRKKLVHLSRSSQRKLHRNSLLVSCLTILTSAADICGTLSRTGAIREFSWADFAMSYAPAIGFLSHVLKKAFVNKMLSDVIQAIEEDQVAFKKMKNLFQKIKELDVAVRKFFPYGIDADLVKKIHNSSKDIDAKSIFLSIVISNWKLDANLLNDKNFIDKADCFSTSEAGKLHIRKLLSDGDPIQCYTINSDLTEEIRDILSISPQENPVLYAAGIKALPSKVNQKIVLNMASIIFAGNHLLWGSMSKESKELLELANQTEEGLKKIQTFVRLLNPSEAELDPIL